MVKIIAPPLIQIELTALSKSEGAITPLPPVSDGPDVKTRFMTGIRSLWFMKKQVKVQQLKEFYLWQILSICFFPLQLYFFFIKRRKKIKIVHGSLCLLLENRITHKLRTGNSWWQNWNQNLRVFTGTMKTP